MRNAGIFAGVAVAAVVVWGWILQSLFFAPAPAGPTVSLEDKSVPLTHAGGGPSSPGYVTGLESLPSSLRDIAVDGGLNVDANGQLVLDVGVRNLFDYFLNAVGEETSEQIVARIRAYIRSHLPITAQAEALRVLDEYLALRVAIEETQTNAEAGPQAASPEDEWSASVLRERKAMLRDLRTRYLSVDVYSAFYAAEDLFDDYTIGKFEIMETPGLTPLQQSEHIAALEQALPEALRASIEAVTRHHTLSALTEQWRLSESDATTLRRIRENIVGEAAADRLEALDVKRTEWNLKVEQWAQERLALLENSALSQQDRHDTIDRRRAELFDASELSRIKAIEYMRDQARTEQ